MDVVPFTVRRLSPADLDAYMPLRREALVLEPLAFGSSPEDDHARDPSVVENTLAATDGRAVFGALDDRSDELVGIVGIFPEHQRKAAHKASIFGMYVTAGARGCGVGDALIRAAITHAREHMPVVTQIHLSVSETAQAAKRLYEKHGFKVWGTEPNALRDHGQSVAEHHMVLMLTD